MRRLLSDTLVVTERNLIRLPRAPDLLLVLYVGDDCRLKPAEREAEILAVDKRAREGYRRGIPVRRKLGDNRPARIPQAQRFGDLVKGLADRVVKRLA